MKKMLSVIIIGLALLINSKVKADPFSQINPGYINASLIKPNAKPHTTNYIITNAKINAKYQEAKNRVHKLPFSHRLAVGYMIQMPLFIIAALLI